MGYRRFAPLMALVVVGLAVLAVRLFQVQVLEHAVWANEAANLVRAGRVLPHRRGRILDRRGRELVRDEQVYQVDFQYRDFRRGHPLGQVVHARSALEMRAVPLDEALEHGREWMLELIELSPSDLRAFAEGAGLRTPTLELPPTDDPEARHRARRASDLRFYVARMLGFAPRDWRALREALAEREALPPFVELVQRWRPGRDPQTLRAEVAAHWARSVSDLEHLAGLLEQEPLGVFPAAAAEPLAELVADLETWRRGVENATANRLFHEAAGFPAGRLHPELLGEHFELDWLAALLRWRPERCVAWAQAARETWLAWRAAWAEPTLLAELQAGGAEAGADRVLDELTRFFADPVELARGNGRGMAFSWRGVERLAALGRLAELLDAPHAPEPPLALPVQAPALRQVALAPDRAWRLVGAASLWRPGDTSFDLARAEVIEEGDQWQAHVRGTTRRDAALHAVGAALDRWEGAFQAACGEHLADLSEAAHRRGRLGEGGRLRFREDRLDRAAERARFVLKDLGSRPIRVQLDPDYELVRLLARYPERFAGFLVREARIRVPQVLDPLGEPLAGALIGRVRRADVAQLHGQRRMAEELRRLQRLGTRTPEQDRLLEELVRQVYQPEEVYGGSGVEGYFDPELRGRNGYEEQRGLQDRPDGSRAAEWQVPAIDGRDVELTLDAELQRAAEHVLAHPAGDPDPELRDDLWLRFPVGALALVDVRGDVLAAASAPKSLTAQRSGWLDDARRRARERGIVRERTMQIPDFQPLGSVFKPFVACWALDHQDFDPFQRFDCRPLEDGRAGYLDLHCWRTQGHGPVDLREALRGSCNAYFARLGDGTASEEFASICRLFGFGQPTGVKGFGPRPGLPEHRASRVLAQHLRERERRLAANGLSVIQGTPLQLARGMAGLATGRLPALRLVQRVGGAELPRTPAEDLDLSPGVMAFVREALIAVVNEPGGTAWGKHLDPLTLGFAFAAKTGSADLPERIEGEEHGVRKHAWLAGWFPATDPRWVLVVFVYDTTRTSSHTAVWLAQQFLATDEVRELVLAEDPD